MIHPLKKFYCYIATLKQMLVAKHGKLVYQNLEILCAMLDLLCGYHPRQLHLDEFVALEVEEYNRNFNLQSVAKHKPLQRANPSKEAPPIEAESDDSLPNEQEPNVTVLDPEEFPYDEDEFDQQSAPQVPEKRFSHQECRDILNRREEISRTFLPGRHREGDIQMAQFDHVFQLESTASLHVAVQPHRHYASVAASANSVLQFQTATAKLLRKSDVKVDQAEITKTFHDLPPAIALAEWEAMFERNKQREDDSIAIVSLPDAWQGPGFLAQKLMSEFTFNEEQKEVLAALVWPLEKAWRQRENKDVLFLPCDQPLIRALIVGGGGCGKTTMLLKILKPLFQTYFSPKNCLLAAPSNKAARLIGGKTLHNLGNFLVTDSLRTYALKIKSHEQRKKLAHWLGAGALVVDEFSQMQATLYHAVAVRASYIRQPTRIADYSRQEDLFGRIACLILEGDHLQLPPVPKSSSLLAPIDNSPLEHQAGVGMFAQIWDVFSLKTAMRFTDPLLQKILSKMRTPGGESLSDLEWEALQKTNLNHWNEAMLLKTADWYHSSYLWSIVSMAVYLKAQTSARVAKEILFVAQAIDSPNRPCLPEHYKEMLQIPNINSTKKIPPFTLFHVGMRIRLTASVLPPWAVQDTCGQVTAVDFHPAEPFLSQINSRDFLPSEYCLMYMPQALYIKLDDVSLEFIPPKVCEQHRLVGFSAECCNCCSFPGVIQLTPQTSRKWKFVPHGNKDFTAYVERTGYPLLPEKTCSLYSLQGSTASPGLVADFHTPKRVSPDVLYLIVYVLLSRVRKLDDLVSIGLNDSIRSIIEAGPPDDLVGTFHKMFDEKIHATQQRSSQALAALGWTQQWLTKLTALLLLLLLLRKQPGTPWKKGKLSSACRNLSGIMILTDLCLTSFWFDFNTNYFHIQHFEGPVTCDVSLHSFWIQHFFVFLSAIRNSKIM